MKFTLLATYRIFFSIFFSLVLSNPIWAELTIDSVYPTIGKLNEEMEIEIRGSNFNQATRVSMAVDSGSAVSVIGSVETPGYYGAIYVSGDTAYVADDNYWFSGVDQFGDSGLQIIDVSNPTNPVIIGSLNTPGRAIGVYVSGDIAYVADDGSGLQIIDVSDPTVPSIIGSLNTLGRANNVYVSGSTAYLADYDGGLKVIDVSDPTAPTTMWSIKTSSCFGAYVSENLAYTVSFLNGLQIFDISDTSTPTLIGSVETVNYTQGFFVSGSTVYVVSGDNGGGLQVIDVTDPSAPTIIGSVDTCLAHSVTISGSTAFVTGNCGLEIIDVSDPRAPTAIGNVDALGSSFQAYVSSNTAYVAGDGGLSIVDVSNPSSSGIIGSVNTGSLSMDLYKSGNTAYVTDDENGLMIIDISDPVSPISIGSLETVSGTDINDVTGSGSTVYATYNLWEGVEGDDINGLYVIDVSDPNSATIIGSVDIYGYAFCIFVSDNLTYVLSYDHDESFYHVFVQAIDVSDPSTPTVIGSVELPKQAYDEYVVEPVTHDLYVSNSIGYVANGDWGLQIIDFSDPTNPGIIASIDTPDAAWGVDVSGTTAYVVCVDSLEMIDISNPSVPNTMRSVSMVLSSLFQVSGSTIYSVVERGLAVYDISDPSVPTLTGVVDTPGSIFDFYIEGNTVYAASADAGFVMVPLPEEIQSIKVNSSKSITCTLPAVSLEGGYNIRVFDTSCSNELSGSVSLYDANEYWQLAQKKAIIIAGGGPFAGNTLWTSTQKCTNLAYQALLTQGYTRNSIYYLSPENTDADNDGSYNDVDGNATLSELSYAINTWAGDTNELLLYFTDHGGTNTFQMNESEILNATELDAWLDDLQTNTHMRQIVVYDACYSGSFQGDLLPPSGEERIVITSTESDEPAWFVNDGTLSFSYQFWGSVMLDGNLNSSFSTAASMMSGEQTPLIDADVNGYTNEGGDYSIANGITICRGRNVERNQPRIGEVCDDQTLNGDTTATVWVSDVTFENGLSKIWAVVEPPGFDDLSTDVPVTDLPTFDLTDTDGDGTYTGSYDGFTFQGDYTVTIYAVDEDDIYSYPAETMVTQNQGITALYVIASPGGGTYNTSQSIQLVASSDAATIYYSFDNDPTTSSNAYAGPITISSSTTIKFMAVDSSGAQSSIYSESYIIDTTAPSAPDISGSENSSTTMNPYPTLCWNEVLDADYYVLQYSASSDFSIYIEVTYLRTDSYTLATALTDYGTWYWRIKAVDAAGNASNWSTGEITYEQDTTVHKAIMVLGNTADTAMSDAMDAIAKQAYSALTYQGFDNDTIHVLGSDTSLDLDGDGSGDLASTSSKTNLQTSITSWASDADDLILFLLGESSNGAFNLSSSETLAGTDLDTWLDTLQTGSTTDAYVIYDASNSGSFLSSLIPPSGSSRIVLTSSGTDEASCYLKDGTLSFSYQFWLQIINSANLYDAFVSGKNMMAAYQQPQIDADGDGTSNEKEDQTAAVDIEIGYGRQAASTPPSIGKTYADQMVGSGTSTTIWAENITSLNPISQVWAMVTPPDQAASSSVVTDLDEITLTDVDGDGQYEGSYTGLTTDGEYTLAVYAKDSLGYFASPKTFKVTKGQSVNTGGSVNFTTPISVEDSITLSAATLVSVRDSYYYRFGYKPSFNTDNYATAKWVMLQDWSTSSTCTTSFAETGSYIWTVDLADSPSPSESLSMMGGVVNVGDINQPVLTGFDVYHSGTTLGTGESVTFSATSVSSSGETPYYLFGYKPNYGTQDYAISKWVKLQDWSTDNTCTTTFDEAGTYIITVDVSDQVGYPASGLLQLMGGSLRVLPRQ